MTPSKMLLGFAAAGMLLGLPAFFSSGVLAQDVTRAPDWITATNKPCKLWNPQPQAHESVTWSGACKDGYASGKGVLHWTENGKPDARFEGIYANGKRNGPGTIILPNGKRIEGSWADDEEVATDKNAI